MKLKRMLQISLVACSLLTLAACSTTHKRGSGEDGFSDTNNDGAQASGVNEGSDFGDSAGATDAFHTRVYYFDFDKSEVKDEYKPAISANADYLAAHPNAKVIVEGHTDPQGSREYNVALGERRANAVADLLKSKGVSDEQIRVVSYGAERLAVPGRSEDAFQQDRRAVIVYTKK